MYMSMIKIDHSSFIMKEKNQFNEEFIHQILLEALNYKSRTQSNLLYRKDKDQLCVYSEEPLSQDKLLSKNCILCKIVKVDNLYNNISNGDVLKLFIRTAPSKKIERDGKRNSARVSLSKKEERFAWVERKLSDAGALVVYDMYGCPLIIENGVKKIAFKHFKSQKNKGAFELEAYDYVITVKITDRDLFLGNVKSGIGPYKSYGCGLILIGA